MKVGLFGTPGSGVTTLFSLFTGRDYDQITQRNKLETVLGEARVADQRLDRLTRIYSPKRTVLATIELAEIPVQLESSGAFTAATVNLLRGMDALGVVIRAFNNPSVPYCHPVIDPLKALQGMDDDAILTDLVQVEARLTRMEKEGRKNSQEFQMFSRIRENLEQGQAVRDQDLSDEERRSISGFRFISEKPWLVLLNIDSDNSVDLRGVMDYCESRGFPWLRISAEMELEISGLPESEQAEFLQDLGEEYSARDRFIRGAYRFLDLISFLTVGDDEVRAWTIQRGASAVDAAGKIHSDLARGFIRAEVVAYDDFISCGDMQAAKKAGKVRLEGKQYVMADGDIVSVRFSV